MNGKSIFRRIVSIAASAAMLVTGLGFETCAASSSETAEKAVASMTVGFNLGNALDSNGDWIDLYTSGKPKDFETAWGNPVTTKAMIKTVKKTGFNAVRVPVTWAQHIDNKGNIDKDWLDRVQEVVDYVIDEDLYCILNVHHDAGSEGWLEASEDCYKKSADKFKGLWKNIAVRFKDYDDKLIFEGFNEILDKNNSWTNSSDSGAYKAVNDFNQLFVDTVRSTGGNNKDRNLMVQVYSGATTEQTLSKFMLPEDSVKDHLIVQVHSYDPQTFTFTDITWATETDKWGSAADKNDVNALMKRLDKYSDKLGAPFVVGEFAAEYKNNDSERAEYAEYFVSKAAEYGIKCFWWDTGGMALLDRNENKMIHTEVVNALIRGSGTKPSADSTSDNKKTDNTKSDKTKTDEKLKAPVVSSKVTKGNIKLSWGKVSGADAYRVYMYNSKTGKYVRKATVKGTSYTVKGLSKGSYKFKVYAADKTSSGYVNGNGSKTVSVKV
ncbi:MAG: cellulase family glycosylhydrolase [Oscillospiraceae bacterium]|nr:cellulase family glycosylhydrolase [Oscillospiraceae bacterium]